MPIIRSNARKRRTNLKRSISHSNGFNRHQLFCQRPPAVPNRAAQRMVPLDPERDGHHHANDRIARLGRKGEVRNRPRSLGKQHLKRPGRIRNRRRVIRTMLSRENGKPGKSVSRLLQRSALAGSPFIFGLPQKSKGQLLALINEHDRLPKVSRIRFEFHLQGPLPGIQPVQAHQFHLLHLCQSSLAFSGALITIFWKVHPLRELHPNPELRVHQE